MNHQWCLSSLENSFDLKAVARKLPDSSFNCRLYSSLYDGEDVGHSSIEGAGVGYSVQGSTVGENSSSEGAGVGYLVHGSTVGENSHSLHSFKLSSSLAHLSQPHCKFSCAHSIKSWQSSPGINFPGEDVSQSPHFPSSTHFSQSLYGLKHSGVVDGRGVIVPGDGGGVNVGLDVGTGANGSVVGRDVGSLVGRGVGLGVGSGGNGSDVGDVVGSDVGDVVGSAVGEVVVDVGSLVG